MKRLLQLGFWPLLAAFLFLLAGCSTQHYRRTADKEAYGVIARKTPLVKNMDEHFSIEQTNQLSLDGLPVAAGIETALGPDGEAEREARVISLEQALDISVHHSRIYQTQKEQLFLQALGLTLARHQFAPIFSAGGHVSYNVTAFQPVDFAPDPNNPTNLIPVFKLAQEEKYDLIILALPSDRPIDRPTDGFTNYVLCHAPCRVFLAAPPVIPQEPEQ